MYTKYIILKLQPNTNDYHIVKEPCLIYSLLCILYTVHKDPKQKKIVVTSCTKWKFVYHYNLSYTNKALVTSDTFCARELTG